MSNLHQQELTFTGPQEWIMALKAEVDRYCSARDLIMGVALEESDEQTTMTVLFFGSEHHSNYLRLWATYNKVAAHLVAFTPLNPDEQLLDGSKEQQERRAAAQRWWNGE